MLAICSLQAFAPAEADVVILGDSNTWIGGDDCSRPKGWNYWFAKSFAPRSCRSYARSGATWSHTADTKDNITENIGVIGDDNVIYNQILRLNNAVAGGRQQKPNVIIIAAGTNDLLFPDKRPDAFADRGAGTVSALGAIMYDCSLLHRDYPDAQIILLSPIESTRISNEVLNDFSERMEALAVDAGYRIIRMDQVGCVRREDELRRRVNTYDGIHTSVAGAKANGNRLSAIIKNIIDGL